MTTQKIIPDVIYLQWYDDDGEESEDVTWCVDRINETDIEYHRKTTTINDDVLFCSLCGTPIGTDYAVAQPLDLVEGVQNA
jgi:hypothetical protein